MALPDRNDLIAFIAEHGGPVDRKQIARAFRLKGAERAALRKLLRELETEGAIDRRQGRRVASGLPEVTVVEVTGRMEDGALLACPARRKGVPAPDIVVNEPGAGPLPATGAKLLVRLRPAGDGGYLARVIRRLTAPAADILGIVAEDGGGLVFRPADRGRHREFTISEAGGAMPGEVVRAAVLPGRRGPRRAIRVVERLGRHDGSGALSTLTLLEHGIKEPFPPEALAEADAAQLPDPARRTDLTGMAFVTVDDEDARDFDDAVFAEPDGEGGWRVTVAIADIASLVMPGSALDREAARRGNSVYMPDRAVPMLPPRLSAGLGSLLPGEERPCLAVELRIGPAGALRGHRFRRGWMRSSARLTYNALQEALNGPDTPPHLAHLEGAFRALERARRRRGALEIDLPERRVVFDREGTPISVVARDRLTAHRIVEEFMIAANVAAAETLEAKGQICMRRVHDRPDPAAVEAMRSLLRDLGYPVSFGELQRPKQFNALLARLADTPFIALVHELVLRAQSRAVYTPELRGHFGLGLARYAHFTSPIRRYADLIVHRALIAALGLGAGRLTDESGFYELAAHISTTERRAAAAERRALDRYAVALLEGRAGEVFEGRIVGVQRFGLFLRLAEEGLDGMLPVAALGSGYFRHDARRHALIGGAAGRAYRLGDTLRVRLTAANPINGGVTLALAEGG
ncbi:MAG: VacB/RNase II family 3'-5' exoribonuclease [Alphaproteobacteria bacterium]|nr:VacB/RNase II family 3'-5' exoribonuclease [Alphaproteobacteria bacterium]